MSSSEWRLNQEKNNNNRRIIACESFEKKMDDHRNTFTVEHPSRKHLTVKNTQ